MKDSVIETRLKQMGHTNPKSSELEETLFAKIMRRNKMISKGLLKDFREMNKKLEGYVNEDGYGQDDRELIAHINEAKSYIDDGISKAKVGKVGEALTFYDKALGRILKHYGGWSQSVNIFTTKKEIKEWLVNSPRTKADFKNLKA